MLRLENITKDYHVADTTVQALKGVSLSFRQNEFVSILGPSGCGKTTLLNIIGGLDKYTYGELTIGGKSTKNFSDADWDVYRNHRVGFIFQSYNLIPHQTVLGNVELALAIAGLSKAERTEKAKRALDRVGLEGQYYKRPNQLSGGQCQRVAIARALVNEPEILLADEPTGALDTATSIQIMELIKEIAQERLVIMVTHNPELAEKYSTRIIRLLDGLVEGDSMPYSEEDEIAEVEARLAEEELAEQEEIEEQAGEKFKAKPKRKKDRAKMSLLTTFRLSAQNLFSKKARTIMTSVAGAIGIIGVSLVLAISFGVKSFIANMQNDMLSGNPIKVEQTAYDYSTLMESIQPEDAVKQAILDGYVNVNGMAENLIKTSDVAESLQVSNNITQDYVDYVLSMPEADVASVFLNYGLDVSNNIYTSFKGSSANGIVDEKNTSLTAIRMQYIQILKEHSPFAEYASYVTNIVDNFQQAPIDEDYILSQYELVGGSKIAKAADEVMIVIDENSELADILLAQLGYYTQDEFMNLVYRGAESSGQSVDGQYDPTLEKTRFSYEELINKTFTYYPNDTVYNMTNGVMGTYNNIEDEDWTTGTELKIVGILRPKKNISFGSLESGFFYTQAFAEKFIEDNKNSDIVTKLIEGGKASISSGWYEMPMTDGSDQTTTVPVGISYNFSYNYNGTAYPANRGFVGTPSAMGMLTIFMPEMGNLLGSSAEMCSLTIQQLGGNSLPESLAIYPVDFEKKNAVIEHLDRWNSNEDIVVNGRTLSGADRDRIVYSDMLSLVINMINSFIDIITVALVGFTSLSLVVSCVMIAIITYVSVVERTKEIGVIRSLGGRKKDVSRLFTAETVIIGLASGLIGIGVTYLLSLIINLVVSNLTMVSAIAILPWWQAAIMVGVSVLLTLISGVFPARAAAKKDPVVALRTE